jgi:uncharacterized protein (DUF305 family)
MNKNPLLYGIIGFILGGLLVSVAATTFDKPQSTASIGSSKKTEMSMSEMTASLKTKSGDDYDKAFITDMIAHHQSAVTMAKLSASRANHQEIIDLSKDIIAAQQKEIQQMQAWQKDWSHAMDMDHSTMKMETMGR